MLKNRFINIKDIQELLFKKIGLAIDELFVDDLLIDYKDLTKPQEIIVSKRPSGYNGDYSFAFRFKYYPIIDYNECNY